MSNITPNVLRGGVSIETGGDPNRYGQPSLSILSGNINVQGSATGSNTIASQNNTTISSVVTTAITGATVDITGTADAVTITNSGATGDGNIIIQSTGGAAGIINISTAATTTTAPLGGINLTTNAAAGANINIGQTGNLTNVKGNLTVDGNLDVKGITTTIDTQTLSIKDNIIVCNSTNIVGSDAGLFVEKRQQNSNDNGLILSQDTPTIIRNEIIQTGTLSYTGPAQSGTSTSIRLDAADTNTAIADFYKGAWVHISGGLGVGQVRQITSYVAGTQTGNVDPTTPFTTAPDNTSIYRIFNDKKYSGLIYRNATSGWELLSAAINPATSGVIPSPTSYEDLTLRNINVTGVLTGPNIGVFTNTSVTINEQSTTATTIPGMSNLAGNGLIFVSGNKTGDTSGCANAVFIFSKGVVAEVGQVNRLVSSRSVAGASPGNGGDGDIELDIVMDISLGPRLKHVIAAPTTSNPVTYSIKFVQM
jgi:hypothetical protein